MGLQSSGAISLNEIHIEAGGSSGTQCSINDSDIRALIDKSSGAQMSFSEWYGASANVTVTLSSNATNQSVSTLFGSDFSANVAKILVINSGVEIGSTSTNNSALSVPSGMSGTLTIQNAGTISGAGGNGETALYIGSNGVTVTNTGTIRGGGGGGGRGANGSPGHGTSFGSAGACYGGSAGSGGAGGNGQGYNQSQSNGSGGTGGCSAYAIPSILAGLCAANNAFSNGTGGSSGGNGGTYGNAGSQGGGSGSAGGSAGKYIKLGSGISYSLSNSGTLQGNAP